MKPILTACLFALGSCIAHSGEVILPYSAFGPQVAAYELIGKAWWQWDSQGDDTDRDDQIKVVVFWDQTRTETAAKHPVDQAKLQDFRYIEYSKAVEHMEKLIKDFKEARLDSSSLERDLANLKKIKAEK